MTSWGMNDELDLKNIGVETDFQSAYRKVLSLLQKGDTGSVTLKLSIKKSEEMDTMVELATSVSMSAPPPKKRKTLGCLDADGGIKVAAIQGNNSNVLTLFENRKDGTEDGK